MEENFWIAPTLCKDTYAIATYLIETSITPKAAVVCIAKEQSLSHWSGDSLVENNLIKKYAAKGVIGSVKEINSVDRPSLATYVHIPHGTYHQFIAKIAYPIVNFGGMLAPMYNTIIGEIHNIGVLTAVKILEIDFPQKFLTNFQGPAFGVCGIREILEEYDSPIFVGPVKPCVGLTPSQFAEAAYAVLKGGFHIVKDDELLVETQYSPFRDRVRKTVQAVKKAESETGRKKMYFPHIGGDSDRIRDLYNIAMEEKADGVMISPAINGLDISMTLRGHLPILAHNTLFYASSRHPLFGVQFSVWAKLQRMCGADAVLNPAPFGSFHIMNLDEHRQNVRACLGELSNFKAAFPAFSGAQSPASLEIHYKLLQSHDFMIVSGSAAYGHPMGAEAGARSFVQAWDAIKRGVPVVEYAQSHDELKISLENFGTNK